MTYTYMHRAHTVSAILAGLPTSRAQILSLYGNLGEIIEYTNKITKKLRVLS